MKSLLLVSDDNSKISKNELRNRGPIINNAFINDSSIDGIVRDAVGRNLKI